MSWSCKRQWIWVWKMARNFAWTSTVVQTDVHHPTDNTLLWDVVRVVTRLVGHLRKAVQQRIKGFRNRTRAARRRMQEIQRLTPKQRHERQTEKYRELIG